MFFPCILQQIHKREKRRTDSYQETRPCCCGVNGGLFTTTTDAISRGTAFQSNEITFSCEFVWGLCSHVNGITIKVLVNVAPIFLSILVNVYLFYFVYYSK